MPEILVRAAQLVNDLVLELSRHEVVSQNPGPRQPLDADRVIMVAVVGAALLVEDGVLESSRCDPRWPGADCGGGEPVAEYTPGLLVEI